MRTTSLRMSKHQLYMQRCLQLAQSARGYVAPNPMVGAVLVYNDEIIGEGYHEKYGEAHAEVNCVNSVSENNRELISKSILYVSLEPCAHWGKTPPCADLIIKHKIPKVVIGCRDPFSEVNGKGIEKLRSAGVEVETGILESECKQLNKRFFCFHEKHRPFIILKWAQTDDKKIANAGYGRLHISNEYTNRVVHKWRSEETAIAVGTNTVLYDNPGLNTRLWPGNDPIRIVVDRELRLPTTTKVFDGRSTTIVFNLKQHTIPAEWIYQPADPKSFDVGYYQVTNDVSLIHQMIHALYEMRIQSVLVEGGALLLQSFIDEALWDEARIITNTKMHISNGLPAPVLHNERLVQSHQLLSDTIQFFTPATQNP